MGARVLQRAPGGGGQAPSVTQLTGLASSTAGALGDILVIFFVAVYTAAAPSFYIDGGLRLLPLKARPRGAEIVAILGVQLRYWILARLVAMAGVGLLFGIGLALIGVPMALLLALLAALLEAVPTVGPIIATVPALAAALTVGTTQALLVIGLFFFIQGIESYVLTPLVEKKAVNLPPALSILVLVLLGTYAGALGALVASPLLLVAITLVREIWVVDILGDRTAREPAPS
ncbi:MAG TPA: AI-2E family transporter [Terriglobales bacterium]|nr:AI-2E family transporter [Terriglobales bacterium]